MMRIAAIEVSHRHSLHDSAYLRRLAAIPDVQLVGVQDPSAAVAAERAAVLDNTPGLHRLPPHARRQGGGEETAPAPLPEPLALRDALDHWRRGAPPPIGAGDCARVAVMIDRAYELATAT